MRRRNDRFSLTTNLQQRPLKIGGRLIKHARYYVAVAERHLTRRLFGGVHRRIASAAVDSRIGGFQYAANAGVEIGSEEIGV